MSEVLPEQNEQNEQRDPRPIGRFLLGLEQQSETKDSFSYAREFARQPGHFERHKHKSRRIENLNELTIDNRGVQLEFMIDTYSYIWKISVAAEPRSTEGISTNYLTHGGERYELHCSVAKNTGYYREYDSQGSVIRQREFDNTEQLQVLQGLVEQLIDQR